MRFRDSLRDFTESVLLPTLGVPLAEIVFSPAIHIRNFLYDQRLISSGPDVPVKIISVGNLTVGGTGKTPIVISLANVLQSRGFRVGIVTRGHKRESSGEVIVSAGGGPSVLPEAAGDEPYLIAMSTRSVSVIANKDRVSASEKLIHTYGCNVILADDGFQHRRLRRDIDIVLWDSTIDPVKERLLPVGRLREPISSVKRADILIFTNSELNQGYQRYAAIFKKFNRNLLVSPAMKVFSCVYSFPSGKSAEISLLKGRRILAFCGIGNPEQFFRFIEKVLKPSYLFQRIFPDHHRYSAKDLELIKWQAEKQGCQYIVTTEKDLVNLSLRLIRGLEVFVLKMEMRIKEDIIQFIESKLKL